MSLKFPWCPYPVLLANSHIDSVVSPIFVDGFVVDARAGGLDDL